METPAQTIRITPALTPTMIDILGGPWTWETPITLLESLSTQETVCGVVVSKNLVVIFRERGETG